ncbi:uncharacterized protein LACBIDRAFT_332670 [Laccaria bicolor S238N-H82]|uniref:Predicted protein n=1 Tax=Laccaria bicolor (strain S238N-H82 / ATCC MYA-4686) TaxID=486041 RepID=B0DTH8_LACBS|nr:uncharacterized protein LACBIDRAFT_332670 [Laccaria bicolor S238N-H82]EDR02066.1 predicted protein [Laccaria bicolor S238N-H82]|eukprot:XP_001887223.1 predicted protein [Laccaria bicolor S238N-H82]
MLNHSLSDQVLQPPFTQLASNEPRNTQDVDANTATGETQRPSAGWLRNPAWIDGGVNPPKYYFSHEEIDAACRMSGVEPPPRYTQPETVVVPSQPYDILSSRVSPTPVPANNHYRAAGPLGNSIDVPPPNGHLVNITHTYTSTELTSSRNAKPSAPKKKATTMLGNITLEGITRVAFIKAILAVHDLHTQFAPGVHSGPPFKLSWTGSTGGKGNAPTFLTDESFSLALAAVLKKDKKKIQVTVEFDTDMMSSYRIQHQAPSLNATTNDGDDELLYGTRIPQLAQFNNAEQINGRFILEIKKRWPCASHQGEHGEPGHCFITASGGHLRLNPLHLKMWAAAMASGDITKHDPPCTEAFDGPRNGQISSIRARGRSGAGTMSTLPAPANNDMMTLVMASLIPVLGGLSRKRSHSESPSRYSSPLSKGARFEFHQFATSPISKPQSALAQPPASPISIPAPGFELRACLWEFAELEAVDMTPFEIALRAEDFTPDIIALADESATIVIRNITGATCGRLMRLKLFCRKWQTTYKQKLLSGNYTTYELE